MGIFEISLTKYGEYQFHLITDSGQVILKSEEYITKVNCLSSIDSVRKNSQDDTKMECKIAVNGDFFFNIKGSNGQVIGTSQLYENVASVENGIETVRSHAPTALISDQTIL